MRATMADKNEKINNLEAQLSKQEQFLEETKQLQEIQAEESKTLKQHVHTFNQENNSLKNLVQVLEADVAKLDDLEAQVEQMTNLYNKEKDLNQQLLNSAASGAGEDTANEGDAEAGVRVSGNATE